MSKQVRESVCEATLLEGLRQGCSASEETLVRAYGPSLLATARRYAKRPEDADDIFQEAFIKIFRNIDRFEGRSSLLHWMRCITIKAAIDLLRLQGRRAETSLESLPYQGEIADNPLLSSPTANAEEQAVSDEVCGYVRTAVHALPASSRTVISLRDFQGASTREAANVLGIAENAVKVRLLRARRALRESLQQTFERGDLLSAPAEAGTRMDEADASVAMAG